MDIQFFYGFVLVQRNSERAAYFVGKNFSLLS